MSDEQQQEMTIDPEHPWAEASMYGGPSPVPTNVKLDSVELTGEGDTKATAALMTIITPVGAMTFFLPPTALQNVLMQGAQILNDWQTEAQQGLVVAGKGEMNDAIRQQRDREAAEKMFRK